jgi:phage tail sheath protein FI
MPEYLAPGVFVEEVSYRAKSIEGVSTTTTGFVGPTRYGPSDLEPDIITSLVEFERIYGGKDKLVYEDDGETDNYMWNAVRAFFEEGGKRLYVARAFTATDPNDELSGCATAVNQPGASPPSPPGMLEFAVRARFPGRAGEGRVTFTLQLGQNRLVVDANGDASVKGAADRDLVWVTGVGAHLLLRDPLANAWRINAVDDDLAGGDTLQSLIQAGHANPEVRTVTVTVQFEPASGDLPTFVAAELPLDPLHQRGGAPDSLFAFFSANPANLSLSRSIPLVIDTPEGATGLEVFRDFEQLHDDGVDAASERLAARLLDAGSTRASRSIVLLLSGGNDGNSASAEAYMGAEDPTTGRSSGLKAFEAIEDISIVAAPGSTLRDDARSNTVIGALISHAERMQYRIAVVDCARQQTIANVRALRARYDSSHAAFYYPWVRILDPLTGEENYYPPSGFVAGIYARNDIERAVYKAPANEVVNLALGFETLLNKAQQEVLNPEGINCFRYFEGRGMRLWGARTMSSDPEWKYVNVRRYFAYLERSIDRGTQWAVFEPNGERLWANVRRTVEDFLLNEWQNGALLGEKPEKAFFVKCDRSTMSQNDLDNGRLVCLIGVAALKPAEFVIFRIGQWTADSKL